MRLFFLLDLLGDFIPIRYYFRFVPITNAKAQNRRIVTGKSLFISVLSMLLLSRRSSSNAHSFLGFDNPEGSDEFANQCRQW
jgi:hypothetical protein